MRKTLTAIVAALIVMGGTAACGSPGCDDYVQADDCGDEDDD